MKVKCVIYIEHLLVNVHTFDITTGRHNLT